MGDELKIDEITQYVKDAGMFEKRMSEKDILNCYEALKESLNSSKDVHDFNTRQLKKLSVNDSPSTSRSYCKNRVVNYNNLYTEQVKIINEPMHYKIAKLEIPTCEKVKLLSKYQDELLKNYKLIEKNFISYKEWGPPIAPTGRVLRSSANIDISSPKETETYTLRTGRVTKKRDYADIDSSVKKRPRFNLSTKKSEDKIIENEESSIKTFTFERPSRSHRTRCEKLFDAFANGTRAEEERDKFEESLKQLSDSDDDISPLTIRETAKKDRMDSSMPALPKKRRGIRENQTIA